MGILFIGDRVALRKIVSLTLKRIKNQAFPSGLWCVEVHDCEHGRVHFVPLCARRRMRTWMCVCAGVREVIRESDADSGVTLGLPVFLLSMKGMT